MASTAVATRPATRTIIREMPAKRVAHKAKFNISIAMVAGLAPTVLHMKGELDAGNGWSNAVAVGTRGMTGYNMANGQWHLSSLKEGFLPLILGVITHKVANRVGINRSVRRLTGGWVSI